MKLSLRLALLYFVWSRHCQMVFFLRVSSSSFQLLDRWWGARAVAVAFRKGAGKHVMEPWKQNWSKAEDSRLSGANHEAPFRRKRVRALRRFGVSVWFGRAHGRCAGWTTHGGAAEQASPNQSIHLNIFWADSEGISSTTTQQPPTDIMRMLVPFQIIGFYLCIKISQCLWYYFRFEIQFI